MTNRGRKQRPTVLLAALLAPAILAGGLMVGEGYDDDGEGRAVVDVVPPDVGLAFEPVYVPAPARADLVYEGSVPAPRRPKERVRVVDVPSVLPSAEERVRVVRKEDPAPVRERESGCPGEWEETWLWELCREHERAPA
ncbi:hypothetical protein ACIBEJ_30555 [Nonomuraea sp. NPDC050790]|uniref:hypothetical protein n=1 Tax=Nonomuraea sp. NPDC050790 TaxID=3364371 RepID=UPI0037A17656